MSSSTGVSWLAYERYIHSPEWSRKRKERLRYDSWRCTGCSTTDLLEVHHLTYERLGYEQITDLVTLCNACHAREHGRAAKDALLVAGPTVDEMTVAIRLREQFTEESQRRWERSLGNRVKEAIRKRDADSLRVLSQDLNRLANVISSPRHL